MGVELYTEKKVGKYKMKFNETNVRFEYWEV